MTRAGEAAKTLLRNLAPLILLVLPCIAPAQELAISGAEHFTENRGWNEAGLGPTYQSVMEGRALENRSLAFSDPYTPR